MSNVVNWDQFDTPVQKEVQVDWDQFDVPAQVPTPQQKQLSGGIKQFDDWLGSTGLMAGPVKALQQQRTIDADGQDIADIYNSNRIPMMPELDADHALNYAKYTADIDGALNFGDSLLNFVPGIVQQQMKVKPEDRRYFDMAGTFRRSDPMAQHLSSHYPEFYGQQASTAEMGVPLPNLSVAKLFTKVPFLKPLGNSWLQAIEKGGAKAAIADSAATGAMLGLQGVPNRNLKEKKEITPQELALGTALGAGMGTLVGGAGVGLSKVLSGQVKFSLPKFGRQAETVTSRETRIPSNLNMDHINEVDPRFAATYARRQAMQAKSKGKGKSNDEFGGYTGLVEAIEKENEWNRDELVIKRIAPELKDYDPFEEVKQKLISQQKTEAAKDKLKKKAADALEVFLKQGTKEVHRMKVEEAREQARIAAEQALFEKQAVKEQQRIAKELAAEEKRLKVEEAKGIATVTKFRKKVIDKEEKFNELFAIQQKIAPVTSPLSDFLKGQRAITKTKKQTFAVEAQNNDELEKRLNKAIQDEDTKAADAMNEEIAKRVNSESKEPDLEPIPQEELQASVVEIEQAKTQADWDRVYGHDRGKLGTNIDEAVSSGLIDEGTGLIANLYAKAWYENRLNEALYENIGKVILKRHGKDEVIIDGVKFSKSKARKIGKTEEGSREMEEFEKTLPEKSGKAIDIPASMRININATKKELLPVDENLSDQALAAMAKEAVKKRPMLDKARAGFSEELVDRYEGLEQKPILNFPIDENTSLGIEYVKAHQNQSWNRENPVEAAAFEAQREKEDELLKAGKAFLKQGVNVSTVKKALALSPLAVAIQQFFYGQAAEAADITTKAINPHAVFQAMSLPNLPELASLASLYFFHKSGVDKKVSAAVDKFINSPESKAFMFSNWLWHDTQDRIELLGKIVGDKSLAKARIEATAKINQLYFNHEMGDPDVAARALHELRTGAVSPDEALDGTAGAFKELTEDQRFAVIDARAYQAELQKAHNDFVKKVDEYKALLRDVIREHPEFAKDANTKLKTISRLESSLDFEESRIGMKDRSHAADRVFNSAASGFGEFHFGSRNYPFQLMNLITDSGILGASYTGAWNYTKSVKDLRLDKELRALFKHSNLAGQRKQDIASSSAEGALYQVGKAIDTVNPFKYLPGLDAEKINADHFALAQAYKYFNMNKEAIKESGFSGDAKAFAKALFGKSEDLDGVVMQDAWNDISVGLWRSHGVDPMGINTNLFAEAPLLRMVTFFTKQPARTARLMTHYLAKGEWAKLYTMLGFMALAGGTAALPVELQYLGKYLAPDQMAEFEKRLDELEIYRRLNPHRTMTPKTEYGAFLWPVMGSVNPVIQEYQDLTEGTGTGAVGSLMKLITEFHDAGKISNKTIEKVIEASAQYAPIKGLNLLINANKGRREAEEGLNLYPKDNFNRFQPSKKKTVSMQDLNRDKAVHIFNRMFMPGVDRAQYEYEKDFQYEKARAGFGKQPKSQKVYDFEKFLRGG